MKTNCSSSTGTVDEMQQGRAMQVAGCFKELGPSPQNAHTNTQFLPYRKELKDHWDCDFRHRSESIRVQGGKRGACCHCYKMNTTGIVPGIDCIVAGFKIFRLLMSQKEASSIWNHFPIPVCFLLLSLSTDPESITHSRDFEQRIFKWLSQCYLCTCWLHPQLQSKNLHPDSERVVRICRLFSTHAVQFPSFAI